MEGPTTRGDSSPSSSSSSAEATTMVATSSSHSPSQPHVQEQEQEQQQQHQQQEQQPPDISYRVNISISDSQATTGMRDEAWSCLAVLVTFWFFASMTMILGFYGSVSLHLGPNCSRILQANSIFVHEIKVTAEAEPKPGPVLYDFSKPPPMDVETSWLEPHTTSVPPNFHKEWIYFLNKGSQVDVSYYVNSTNSASLSLVIAHGKESLIEWIEEPSYPNTTLSWNIIHGSGVIHQKIFKASEYYIAVGNLNQEDVEVQLNFSIKAVQYNTTGAYSECSLDNNLCVLKLFMFGANAAVLTTPGIEEGSEINQWYVKLSYGPRWITYFVISGGVTIIMLLAFKIFNKFENRRDERVEHQEGDVGPERTPLLNQKDDDALSWGSSYDSVSHDEEDPEDWSGAASLEAKSLKESETNTPRRLCVICYDSPRDCFFLPCGHCATCFPCGTRIAEEASVCPICRRKMKKVRKIFTV